MSLSPRWLKENGVTPRQPLPNAILKKMENFSQCNKLKRIALKLIAGMLPERETEGLKTIFDKMDQDGDGWINLDEMKSAMREKGSLVGRYKSLLSSFPHRPLFSRSVNMSCMM